MLVVDHDRIVARIVSPPQVKADRHEQRIDLAEDGGRDDLLDITLGHSGSTRELLELIE